MLDRCSAILCHITAAFLLCGHATVVAFETDIIHSPNDTAEYGAAQLDNGLRVLLVSDPDTDKAAAALTVRVGSRNDPRDRPGLAHFLEHMLFLGTDEYPEAGDYHRFISANGGSQNAFTSYEFTTYFFDIEPRQLEPALDRFARFFVAPLFTPRYVDREINAVESEFRSRIENDARRRIEAEKTVMNQTHPYTKFQGGNLETLRGGDIRAELVSFYEANYSADRMTLVVYGAESLDVLEQWVQERFSAVRRIQTTIAEPTVPLFSPETLPLRLNVEPVKDQRSVHLVFPIEPIRHQYQSKPLHYVANLLGHEGEGSLLSTLKSRGWADDLSAGAGLSHDTEATFSVHMSLTEAGLEHVDDIVDLFFEQIHLIGERGVRRWTFDEQKQLSELGFRFKQRSEPAGYVTSLATSLHLYPAHDVLYGPYRLSKFDADAIARVLARLTPNNMLMTVTAKGLPVDNNTSWMKTPYSTSALEQDVLARWRESGTDNELALPVPNQFLPKNLSLETVANTDKPVVVERADGLSVWHQTDVDFGTPRASFFVALQTRQARADVRSAVMTRLFINLINDSLNEFSYPAALAGLGYNLYPTMKGMTVRVSGYSDKQPLLLESIVSALSEQKLSEKRFEVIKQRHLRRLRNSLLDQPYAQARSEIDDLLLEPGWTIEQQLAALETVDYESLRFFARHLFDEMHVLSLSHGNTSVDDARAMTRVVTDTLDIKTPVAELGESRVVKLERGFSGYRTLSIEHDDSVVVLYIQGRDRSLKERANFALLSQILSSPYYTELRTEKQLGYIVFATYSRLLGVPGVEFVVQSPSVLPNAISEATESFLTRYRDTLAAMTAETFETHKFGVVSTLLEEDKTLWDQSVRYWYEIDRREYEFDSTRKLADVVSRIEKSEFETFFVDRVLGGERASIRVSSIGRPYRAHVGDTGIPEHGVRLDDTGALRRQGVFFERRVSNAEPAPE